MRVSILNTTMNVRDFMVACGQEVSNNIYEPNSPQNTRLYLRLITEEYFELLRSFSEEKEIINKKSEIKLNSKVNTIIERKDKKIRI